MLKTIKITAIALIAFLISPLSLAHDYESGQIHIEHPWSREAPPNAPVIGGFFQLSNLGDADDALIAAAMVGWSPGTLMVAANDVPANANVATIEVQMYRMSLSYRRPEAAQVSLERAS